MRCMCPNGHRAHGRPAWGSGERAVAKLTGRAYWLHEARLCSEDGQQSAEAAALAFALDEPGLPERAQWETPEWEAMVRSRIAELTARPP